MKAFKPLPSNHQTVVTYLYTYTDRQTAQILFCCGDLNTINSDFPHGAQL